MTNDKTLQKRSRAGIAIALLCVSLLSSARADVKNVWIGVNGAT